MLILLVQKHANYFIIKCLVTSTPLGKIVVYLSEKCNNFVLNGSKTRMDCAVWMCVSVFK